MKPYEILPPLGVSSAAQKGAGGAKAFEMRSPPASSLLEVRPFTNPDRSAPMVGPFDNGLSFRRPPSNSFERNTGSAFEYTAPHGSWLGIDQPKCCKSCEGLPDNAPFRALAGGPAVSGERAAVAVHELRMRTAFFDRLLPLERGPDASGTPTSESALDPGAGQRYCQMYNAELRDLARQVRGADRASRDAGRNLQRCLLGEILTCEAISKAIRDWSLRVEELQDQQQETEPDSSAWHALNSEIDNIQNGIVVALNGALLQCGADIASRRTGGTGYQFECELRGREVARRQTYYLGLLDYYYRARRNYRALVEALNSEFPGLSCMLFEYGIESESALVGGSILGP